MAVVEPGILMALLNIAFPDMQEVRIREDLERLLLLLADCKLLVLQGE